MHDLADRLYIIQRWTQGDSLGYFRFMYFGKFITDASVPFWRRILIGKDSETNW